MSFQQNLRDDANVQDQKANDLLREATAALSVLIDPNDAVDQPYFDELRDLIARDDLVGDFEKLDHIGLRLWLEIVSLVTRIRKLQSGTEGDGGLIRMFIASYGLRLHWYRRLADANALISQARSYRKLAMGLRDIAQSVEDTGTSPP